MTKKHRAPTFLEAPTRTWWEDTCTRWELEPHHVRLLTLAGSAWDRGEAARRIVEREGLTTMTPGGMKRHPCVTIENECRTAFSRLIRELDLDLDPPATAARPPMLRSIG